MNLLDKRKLHVYLFISLMSLSFALIADGENEVFRYSLLAWRSGGFGDGSRIEGPLSVDSVENQSLNEMHECIHCPQVPFGYNNSKWCKFRLKIELDDALVFYSTDTESKRSMMGEEGYAIIRNRKVVDTFITRFY